MTAQRRLILSVQHTQTCKAVGQHSFRIAYKTCMLCVWVHEISISDVYFKNLALCRETCSLAGRVQADPFISMYV